MHVFLGFFSFFSVFFLFLRALVSLYVIVAWGTARGATMTWNR